MSVDISKLDNKQLAMLCIKHNIISKENLSKHTKEQVVEKVERWCEMKKKFRMKIFTFLKVGVKMKKKVFVLINETYYFLYMRYSG